MCVFMNFGSSPAQYIHMICSLSEKKEDLTKIFI
jgi:hypothetical protein